ncbi:MAG: sulfotransferase [Chloroflexota bacterium]
MRARVKSIFHRNKFIKGTIANSINFWKYGNDTIQLPDILPSTITPYAFVPGKDEIHFVETPSDYELQGKPFLYNEQFRNAQRVYEVSYDEWFKWLKSQPLPDKPIFVCGIGRSGTTLMARAMYQLSNTTVYDEPDVYVPIIRLPQEEQIPLIQASTASFNQHGTRLVIKHRSFVSYMIESLLEAHPNAKILYMYRNTYDWIISNMRLILRTPWHAGVVHELIRIIFKHFLPALDPSEFRGTHMVESGALLWLRFNEHYTSLVEQGYPVLGIRYEDLVDAPESVMSQVFDFCELPTSQVATALGAFERNSQSGTIFSHQYLADVELNERQKSLIQGMLNRHEWMNDPYMRLPGSVEPRHRELA